MHDQFDVDVAVDPSFFAPTPVEQAQDSLDAIRTELDTAKQDRGEGIGHADSDGIWSINDLKAMVENEHGYYSTAQVEHAQTVLTMAESSPEARELLGITESGGGWSFSDIGHLTLDIVGMVPIAGNAADAINATWYLAEGKHLDAALSSLALIPAIGIAVAAAKPAIKAAANGRIFNNLDEALTWARSWLENAGILTKNADEAGAAARGADSAANRASHEQFLVELRRNMERPIVDDIKLNLWLDELWKPTARVGNKSTAAAARVELANPGVRVGGRLHVEKAQGFVVALQGWIRNNPAATVRDRAAAENVLRDLQDALDIR